jgi:protein-disulfide isomerase
MGTVVATRLQRLGRSAKAALELTGTIMVIVAAGSVLVLTLANWRARADAPLRMDGPLEPSPPATPHRLDGATLLGNREARVVLIQYSDFECPFCAQFARDTWPAMKKRYVESGKVLAAFRHLPLASHQHARQAAVAANCAGQQGKFWEMHDGLFEHQSTLAADTMRTLASRLQLDVPAYEQCVRQHPTDDLSADQNYASTSGIHGTPTFLIGVMTPARTVQVTNVLVGAQPLSRFTPILDDLLSGRGK